MNSKLKKPLLLGIGLLVFATLGTGVVFHSGMVSRPAPTLSSGYKFFKGISGERLELSRGEVIELNKCFWENRDVLKKAQLTVVGENSSQGPSKMTPQARLKFSLKLEGKDGMSYSPEKIPCNRSRLVDKIRQCMGRGAKVLASYKKSPDLRNRQVSIVDM